jgi:hypothetical protein
MMSLEGTKTINERGKGVGLFFVMKDTGWKKHHKKGRLFWENTKNIHELRPQFVENTQHSTSSKRMHRDQRGMIGFAIKSGCKVSTLVVLNKNEQGYIPVVLDDNNFLTKKLDFKNEFPISAASAFYAVNQVSGDNFWQNGGRIESYEETINKNNGQIQQSVNSPDVHAYFAQKKKRRRSNEKLHEHRKEDFNGWPASIVPDKTTINNYVDSKQLKDKNTIILNESNDLCKGLYLVPNLSKINEKSDQLEFISIPPSMVMKRNFITHHNSTHDALHYLNKLSIDLGASVTMKVLQVKDDKEQAASFLSSNGFELGAFVGRIHTQEDIYKKLPKADIESFFSLGRIVSGGTTRRVNSNVGMHVFGPARPTGQAGTMPMFRF